MQTTNSKRALFKRLIIRLILTITLILLFVYGLPYFFQLFYPFIFAFLLAAIVNPLVNLINGWLSKSKVNTSVSRNIITFLLTIFILLLMFLFFYWIIFTLITEIVSLATNIQNNWSNVVFIFENFVNWVTIQIDILSPAALEIFESFTANLLNFIQDFSRNLLNYTVSTTGSIISTFGSFSLNALTFFLSLYFVMSDFDNMKRLIRKHTDQKLLNTASLLKNTVVVGVGGYVKTQLILASTAFVVMFIAFLIYGQEYAFTIAIFLAIIDLIPLIGTIAALAPWGIFEFFIGDLNFGIFLIILSIGFFLLRRVLEPKIMGSQTGLHPLLALIGIYVGIQFSGLWGALLGPLVMVIIIGIVRSGILDNTFADINELYHTITRTLERKK